jgi:hypothetical protein
MPAAVLEPEIPASKRPKTHALNREDAGPEMLKLGSTISPTTNLNFTLYLTENIAASPLQGLKAIAV